MVSAVTSSSFFNVLVQEISPLVSHNLKLSDLKDADDFVCELIKRNTPRIVIEQKDTSNVIFIERAHTMLKHVLKHLQTNEPVFLTGPAGSGKSTIAEQCAESLSLPFSSISVCAQTTKTDFLGYRDANGNYIDTLFRRAYENGELYLIDEIDAGNPNVLSILNAALSNNSFAFPDKMVKKHKDFLLVATANTLGCGSTEYVGRNQLDIATLDRFNFIYIDYDSVLEKSLIPSKYINIYEQFLKVRHFVKENKIPLIISTRSLIKIIKLLEADVAVKDALTCTIFKSANDDLIDKILTAI